MTAPLNNAANKTAGSAANNAAGTVTNKAARSAADSTAKKAAPLADKGLVTTTAGKAAGFAAVLTSLWLMRQSYLGHKDEWVLRAQKVEDETNMADWRYRRANWSGQPAMDGWGNRLNQMLLRGPGDIRLIARKGKIMAEGLFSDVLMPNLFPMAIAAGGLYHGLGENGRQAIVNKLRGDHPFFKSMWDAVCWSGGVARSGLGKVANGFSSFTAKNPLASALLLGLGIFGANRFKRAHNGQEQDKFFRDFIAPPPR